MRKVFLVLLVLLSCASTRAQNGPGNIPTALGWYQVPNTSLDSMCETELTAHPELLGPGGEGCAGTMADWSGGLMDTSRSQFIIFGGGHTGWAGNDIWAITFTGTPTPSHVRAATVNPNLRGTGDFETNLDGTPTIRHTYMGWQYLEATDEYFLYGGGSLVNGNFEDGNYVYKPKTNQWVTLTPATHPTTAQHGDIPNAVYNRKDGCLYMIQNEIGPPPLWQYCRDINNNAKSWTQINAGLNNSPCTSITNYSAAIDIGRQLFVCIGSGNLFTIDLNSFTVVNDSVATGCVTPASVGAPGIDYDPVQQVMIIYTTGNTYYSYNPSTHVCTLNPNGTFIGGPGGAQQNGTFGRFRYNPQTGTFLVVNSMTGNVYSLRLVSLQTGANTDWTNRSTAAGVIVADTFGSASVLPVRTCQDNNSGAYPADTCFGGSNANHPTVDTTTFRSGTGSMHFTIPGGSGLGSQPDGYYRRLFQASQAAGPGTATVFGQNTDWYVQYAQKMDVNFVTNTWVRSSGGNSYWKQQIFSNDTGTCAQEELTTVNINNAGYPLTYSQCGQDPFQVNSTLSSSGIYNEFNSALIKSGSYNGSTQTLTGGAFPSVAFNCEYNSAQPNANCFDYSAHENEWVTYYYHVHIGTWGAASSTVEGWVSSPGSPVYRQWLYSPNHVLNQDAGVPGYDMVTLLVYMTCSSCTLNAPNPSNTWYGELLVSSQPIVAPSAPPADVVAGGSGGPAVMVSTVSFGNQAVGATSLTLSATVTNSGTSNLVLSGPFFNINGTNGVDFSNVGSGTCVNGLTLGANQSCSVALIFLPSVTGAESASLNILGNANGSGSLTGTGIAASGVAVGLKP